MGPSPLSSLRKPLGIFTSNILVPFSFITAKAVTGVVHHACVVAHPDPQHQLRRNIKSLVAHSNRVTSTVCLQQGGALNHEIAFRLCWKPASVLSYLLSRHVHQYKRFDKKCDQLTTFQKKPRRTSRLRSSVKRFYKLYESQKSRK
jgi:hypothetical protein